MHFEHPYSSGYWRRTAKRVCGALEEIFTVTANIQLQPDASDYNAEKENELVTAAVDYAHNKAVDVIEFEQGEIVAHWP